MFGSDGGIRIATINAPGTCHDSTMADYGVYNKMSELYKHHKRGLAVRCVVNRGAIGGKI